MNRIPITGQLPNCPCPPDPYSFPPPGPCSFPPPDPCSCPPPDPCSCLPPDPSSPAAWDYGFHRLVSFIQSPTLIAGILGITVFLVIVFSSTALLTPVTFATLGITITLATLAFLAIIVLLLFLI